VLETRDLTRRFGSFTAVDRLNIRVDAGEVFGLLGPNGAGKTTIKILTTLLAPTAGTASVGGYDVVRQAAAVRRLIGYVPQLISADGNLTGYENLMIFAKLYALPRADRERRIHEALEFMELSGAARQLVRAYSGGMIRRLEIAQAMLHRPPVLFLDEPTIGVDPGARRAVWQFIGRLREEYGTTVVLTTHLMDEAENLCSRVAILSRGRITAAGTPAALKTAVTGRDGAAVTFDDVFMHYTDEGSATEGGYREAARVRRVARRLG